MKVSTNAGRGVLVLGLYVGVAMAGMGADGGFDADMMKHFPGFFRVRATSGTLFAFSNALGGIPCEPVTSTSDSARPFACNGNTFTTFADAAKRSCDDQNNACSDLANNKNANTGGITVSQCGTQRSSCVSAISAGPQSAAAAAPPPSTTTSTTSTTPIAAVAAPSPATTTTAAAAPPPKTTTAVQVQLQTTTQQVAAPVVVVNSTPQAVAPVVATTPSVVQGVVASVASPSATLHSSDENFFYFCDP